MRNPKIVFISFLLILFEGNILWAQTSTPDCDDIKVEARVINPTGGGNGSIELVFQSSVSDYKVFWLNAGSSKTGKEEVEDGKLRNLKAGFYDFLIIDKNKKGCTKQLTVILK
jgi:hypothetical protein